jgi:formylglycine-generating enzyme required for sulfatase activity
MRGEISQGQWVAFFNSLNATQKATRDITSATNSGKNTDSLSFRNNVSWSSGNATLSGGSANYRSVGMGYLSWGDLTAYLDWAGLRPMSELEYEKAGRGPAGAVSGEYAWGSTSITGATSITNGGTASERGNSGSNINYNSSLQGPTRVGSFGGQGTSRVDTGASYYGAFDLSGNLWERSVTMGNSTGRSFQGTSHGDGNLDTNGDANQSSWPSISATGAGFRGGCWDNDASYARLSGRFSAAYVYGNRSNNYGGRGVRSAAP